MRIAVLSDIHGNTLALAAVLADLATRQIDAVVNLGDIVSGGLDPLGTMALLDTIDATTVRGNHDRQVAEGTPGLSDDWARQNLPQRTIERLGALPLTAVPAPGVWAFHGTPSDDLTYLVDTVEESGARAATTAEVVTRLGDAAEGWDLLLCGHTHLARQMRLPSGTLVVNPGSVGMPAYTDDVPFDHVMEAGSPRARYAIVEKRDGQWHPELCAIDYDWETAALQAERHNRPDIARALRTGTARG